MAYRCPVCAEPQADAEHLANHIAFTALIRGADHEEWLDEHTPNWGEDDDETLAARLRDLDAVTEIGHPIDEADTAHDHASHRHPETGRQTAGIDALDEEERAVLEEARELTARGESDGETE